MDVQAVDTIVCILQKGSERYVLFFNDDATGRTLAQSAVVEWAANKRLSLSWWDAGKMYSLISETTKR